jgi:hypothetical protein
VIPGSYEGVFTDYEPPAFCGNCGNAFPWTNTRITAAKEMTDDAGQLSEDEKTELKEAIDQIVRETPTTERAAHKFKRLAAKAGLEFATGARTVLVDVVSESVKKVIWGP